MRPINNKVLPRGLSLDGLTAANNTIGTANELTWDEYLKLNEEEARKLRTSLWHIGAMKCWFSEAELQVGEGHIEHFRPKGKVAGETHTGYKWRKFDWRNFRLAHPTVNLRRTDFLTGKLSGKGTYFPLRDDLTRAHCIADEVNEEPILLDPVIASDTLLLCFDEASGAPRPRYEKKVDEWRHKRAEDSIDYYHLNEGTWNVKRADLMATVRTLCNQLEAIVSTDDPVAYSNKIDAIIEFIHPSAPFSAACRQVVRERGMLEVVNGFV